MVHLFLEFVMLGSSISRENSCRCLYTRWSRIGVASTKAFTTQITVLTMIALAFAKAKGTLSHSDFHMYSYKN
jgi:glucosamine--fructose-6-phosphate aminotransferase (isomerizing)